MEQNRRLATFEVLKDNIISCKNSNEIDAAVQLYHDFAIGSLPRNILHKWDLQVAQRMLVNWLNTEYDRNYSVDDIFNKGQGGDISIAYTELGDENQYPVQVYVNLAKLTVKYQITDDCKTRWISQEEHHFASLDEMINEFLEWLDFDELISIFYDYLDE